MHIENQWVKMRLQGLLQPIYLAWGWSIKIAESGEAFCYFCKTGPSEKAQPVWVL